MAAAKAAGANALQPFVDSGEFRPPAPEDPNSPDPWVGFQGAINPDCWFNWRKRQLVLWAVQNYGGDDDPWDKARRACFAKFAAACAERRAREAK